MNLDLKVKRKMKFFVVFVILCMISASFSSIAALQWQGLGDDGKSIKKEREDSYTYSSESVTVIGAEGVKLPGHVCIPDGTPPHGGFPVVIFIHSWMMNQIEYVAQEDKFAKAGYITFAYDCRGWGFAEGLVGTAGPLEMQDLSKVIDWIIDNTPADPKNIGVIGVSYGGGQSLLAPAFDERVKTVVSMSGWADLTNALVPNGSPKWLWSMLLVGSASLLARPDPEMIGWLVSYLLDTPQTDETNAALWERSPMKYIDEINRQGTPIFIINGLNDDLFSSGQMVRFYDALGVPKKLTLANGIHATAEAPGLLFLPSELWDDAREWFDYWLWGEKNGILHEPAVNVYQNWNNEMGEFNKWPVTKKEKTFYLTEEGLESTAPRTRNSESTIYNVLPGPVTSGIPAVSPLVYSYLRLPVMGAPELSVALSPAAASFETESLSEAMAILGTPKINIWLTPSQKEFQVNVFFYDVGPLGGTELIGHATYTEKDATPGRAQLVSPQTDVISHKISSGHTLRVIIATSDIAYALPLLPVFTLDINHDAQHKSSISLPVL